MAQITADLLRSKFGFNDENVINNILKDPGQVQRYTREAGLDPEYNAQQAINKQAADRAAFNDRLRGESDAFLNRFKTELPAALTGIENELGLPALREQATTQQHLLEDLPGNLENTGRAASVNADRLGRATAIATAKQAPIAQRAIEQAQTAEQLFTQKAQQALVPYQAEIDLMKDRFAREATGFNQDSEDQLNLLLKKMDQQGQLTIAEMQQATQLAELEQKNEQFKAGTTQVDVGDRIAILDSSGREIGSIAKGLAPTRTGTGSTTDISKYLTSGSSIAPALSAIDQEYVNPAISDSYSVRPPLSSFSS